MKILFAIFCIASIIRKKYSSLTIERDEAKMMSNCLSKQIIQAPDTDILCIYDNALDPVIQNVKNHTVNIFKRSLLNNITKEKKINMLVMRVNKIQEFKDVVNVLSKYSIWNPRAEILVGYTGNENITEFFTLSWQYFIININIITINGSIYTYFPYKNNRCGQEIESEIISYCQNETEIYFPSKIPHDLGGCEVRIMPYPMIPYVINISASRHDPSKAGLEGTIMHSLATKINFTENYVKCPYVTWGYKERDTGKYIMMFGALYNNETDILMGMTYGNASHVVDFDGSFVYLIDYPVWWVPSAAPAAHWKNLTLIFTNDLWLIIFLMFLINGIVWWIIGRKQENSNTFKDLALCIMASLYSLLQGSVGEPKKWKLRMIFILWLISCVLLFTAHQSSLISILTTPLYDHQIATVEEMIKSSLSFGFYQGAASAFQDKSNWIFREILKRYIECPLSLYCLNKTAFDRDFSFMRNLRNAKYFIPRFYTFPNGRIMIHQLDLRGPGIWVRLHTVKGLPILDRINNLLLLLQANGLINKWDKDTSFKGMKIESEPDHTPLSLSHLQGAFFIFVFGMTTAAILLVCEIICNQCLKYNIKIQLTRNYE